MGTRSVLCYEKENGKIYCQYLQWDGYPEEKGKKYLIAILRSLSELSNENSIGKTPNGVFFKRIQCFLNEIQYESAHSIGSHFTVEKKDWFPNDTGVLPDIAGTVWRYLFTRNGDFIFTNGEYIHTIPYNILTALAYEHELIEALEKSNWWKLLNMAEYEEHKTIFDWKDPFPHVNDELQAESSRNIRDQLLKGIKTELSIPTLKVTTEEILAFPEQKESGWRTGLTLQVGYSLEYTTTPSMFTTTESPDCPKRNKQILRSISTKINGKKLPGKQL